MGVWCPAPFLLAPLPAGLEWLQPSDSVVAEAFVSAFLVAESVGEPAVLAVEGRSAFGHWNNFVDLWAVGLPMWQLHVNGFAA